MVSGVDSSESYVCPGLWPRNGDVPSTQVRVSASPVAGAWFLVMQEGCCDWDTMNGRSLTVILWLNFYRNRASHERGCCFTGTLGRSGPVGTAAFAAISS